MAKVKKCKMADCGEKHYALGLCKYHYNKRAYHINKSNKEREQRLCACGCGRWFYNNGRGRGQTYFEFSCRPSTKGQVSKNQPKQFRKTICRGFNIDGSGYYGGMCAHHEKCLDNAMLGKKFKYEKNKGKNCYKASGKVERVNYGTSGAMCSENY